jgi:putative ABC transport system permease protein
MNNLWLDFCYALRVLGRNPGFTAIAILTLALGIGANAAIFRIANAVLFRSLPFPHADKLVELRNAASDSKAAKSDLDPTHWWTAAPALDSVARYSSDFANLEDAETPGQVAVTVTTGRFFRVMGVAPLIGRVYAAEEADAHAPVAVIGYKLWRRFAGRASALGKTLELNGREFHVIGIMPSGFSFPSGSEVWIPYPKSEFSFFAGPVVLNQIIARLRAWANTVQAQSEVDVLYRRLQKAHPDVFPSPKNLPKGTAQLHFNFGVTVIPLRQFLYGDVRLPLLFLLLSAAIVWLVACANLAGLILVRTTVRQEEMAVRSALGASAWQLMRMLWLESLVLAAGGGALGVALAAAFLRALLPWVPSSIVSITAASDWPRLAAFVFLLSFGSTLLFGLMPAAAASWPSLIALVEHRRGGRVVTPGGQRARQVLLGAETAVTLALLVAAGLLIKSFWCLSSQPQGFDPHHVLTASVPLPSSWSDEKKALFYRAVIRRIDALPGVEAAGVGSCLPSGHVRIGILELVPADESASARPVGAVGCAVSSKYFNAMRIPVIGGRSFTAEDTVKGQAAAILNVAAAKQLWPGQLAVGRTFGLSGLGPKPEFQHKVIGVVGDTRSWGFTVPTLPIFYVPYEQGTFGQMFVVVRTELPPDGLASALRSAVWSVDKAVPVLGIESMQQRMAQSISAEHFRAWLSVGFAALALVLACVGIFGMVSYDVARRTREIGIRMALGAGAGQVTQMMLRRGVLAVLTGAAVGLGGAYALGHWLASLLFPLQPTDHEVFIIAVLVVVLAATVAAWLPARLAARVAPAEALRHE